MKRPIGRTVIVALVLASSLWACATQPSNSAPTAPTTPTTPEAVTETFTGTLSSQGTAYHTFVAKSAGTVTTTLTGITPDASLVVGLAVGTWDGFLCTPVVVSETAKVGSVLIGTATAPITLCVKVYDVGNVTDPATYTVTTVHY